MTKTRWCFYCCRKQVRAVLGSGGRNHPDKFNLECSACGARYSTVAELEALQREPTVRGDAQ